MKVLVDSNIPMYLVGAAHPNKEQAIRALDHLLIGQARLVTDTEVLQEILHRYCAAERRHIVQPAFDVVARIVDEILPVTATDMEIAKRIALGDPGRSARDALHLAVMENHGIVRILSFDTGFDAHPGIERLP